jgi:hypothetical protein
VGARAKELGITRLLLGFVPLALMLSACESSRCRPTTTTVTRAAAVDLGGVTRSGVLSATVRSGRLALNHKWVRFFVERRKYVAAGGSETVQVGGANTLPNGVATFDLKKLPPLELARDAMADEVTAMFSGDDTYCPSSGRAPFDTVHTQSTPAAPAEPATLATPRAPDVVPRVRTRVDPVCPPVALSVAVNEPCTGISAGGLDPHLP